MVGVNSTYWLNLLFYIWFPKGEYHIFNIVNYKNSLKIYNVKNYLNVCIYGNDKLENYQPAPRIIICLIFPVVVQQHLAHSAYSSAYKLTRERGRRQSIPEERVNPHGLMHIVHRQGWQNYYLSVSRRTRGSQNSRHIIHSIDDPFPSSPEWSTLFTIYKQPLFKKYAERGEYHTMRRNEYVDPAKCKRTRPDQWFRRRLFLQNYTHLSKQTSTWQKRDQI